MMEFDLFGDPVAAPAPRKRASQRRLLRDDAELAATIRRLAGERLTRREIAARAGIGLTTLSRLFFAEINSQGTGTPGRPPHRPTRATRAAVSQMVKQGLKPDAMARALGISLPTVWKYYRAELAPFERKKHAR